MPVAFFPLNFEWGIKIWRKKFLPLYKKTSKQDDLFIYFPFSLLYSCSSALLPCLQKKKKKDVESELFTQANNHSLC